MWPNPQLPIDLVTITAEILNEKLHFSALLKLKDISFIVFIEKKLIN